MKVKTILVPVDLDELATRTLEIVPRLLAGKDRSVLLQHVIDADSLRVASELYEVAAEDMIARARSGAEEALGEYAALLEGTGIEVTTVVSVGVPFREILKIAEDFVVDMILMSRGGKGGDLERFMFGGVSEKVIRLARCPVLLLPSGLWPEGSDTEGD
ncbi:MAG: universal stress protein [Myxococcales bacterium]|nr:universal stress protein [Myxococcales bacterium]